jgi:hypothetical protein
MEAVGSSSGKTKKAIIITDCGELNPPEFKQHHHTSMISALIYGNQTTLVRQFLLLGVP